MNYEEVTPDYYAGIITNPKSRVDGNYVIANDNGQPFTGVKVTNGLIVANDFNSLDDAATWLTGTVIEPNPEPMPSIVPQFLDPEPQLGSEPINL